MRLQRVIEAGFQETSRLITPLYGPLPPYQLKPRPHATSQDPEFQLCGGPGATSWTVYYNTAPLKRCLPLGYNWLLHYTYHENLHFYGVEGYRRRFKKPISELLPLDEPDCSHQAHHKCFCAWQEGVVEYAAISWSLALTQSGSVRSMLHTTYGRPFLRQAPMSQVLINRIAIVLQGAWVMRAIPQPDVRHLSHWLPAVFLKTYGRKINALTHAFIKRDDPNDPDEMYNYLLGLGAYQCSLIVARRPASLKRLLHTPLTRAELASI